MQYNLFQHIHVPIKSTKMLRKCDTQRSFFEKYMSKDLEDSLPKVN